MADEIKDYSELLTLIANEYENSGVPLDQLIMAGRKGLSQALDLSTDNSAFGFGESVSWFIRQSILKTIKEIKNNKR